MNVRRHAAARRVSVTLEATDDLVRDEVTHDGRGFDPEIRWNGVGLSAMEERASRLGGRLRVSSEPGRETRVTMTVPLSSLTTDVKGSLGPSGSQRNCGENGQESREEYSHGTDRAR